MNFTRNRIVVVGGRVGGLFMALNLAGEGEVTLASRSGRFLFTPLLYEYLSGEVEAWRIAPDYRELLDENVRTAIGLRIDYSRLPALLQSRFVIDNVRETA
jgi:NADH:ubiquinone reductase (non-electrogenic)